MSNASQGIGEKCFGEQTDDALDFFSHEPKNDNHGAKWKGLSLAEA